MAKLREFDAPGSASKVGSKESLSAEASPASRVIKGRKQATSSTDILACYGLVGSAAKRALEAEFESAAEEVEEEEAESMDCLEISSEDAADASAQHDLAISRPIGKPYFDPSRGKFIQLLEDGSEQEGIMSPGPLGFCVVKLPDCEAFESQVPNLFLEAPAERKATRFQAPKKKARKISKAKSLAKAPELEAAEALEDDGSDGSANALENDSEAAEIPDMQITALAEASFEAGSTKEVGPGSAPKWNGYDLSALPIDVRPSVDSKGKHSFTVKREEGKISVDILLRPGAFWVKKPEQCKGQYSWARYSSVHEA